MVIGNVITNKKPIAELLLVQTMLVLLMLVQILRLKYRKEKYLLKHI